VVVNRPLGVVKSEVNVSKAPPVVNRARRYFLSGGSRRPGRDGVIRLQPQRAVGQT